MKVTFFDDVVWFEVVDFRDRSKTRVIVQEKFPIDSTTLLADIFDEAQSAIEDEL